MEQIKKVGYELEPKKKNRWIVKFPAEFEIEPYFVNATQRPSIRLVDNKIVVSDITFTFIDTIGPSVSEKLMNLTRTAIERPSFARHFSYELELLDPIGNVIEKWKISDCTIKSVNFGELDYGNSEILKCIMTITVGNAELVN